MADDKRGREKQAKRKDRRQREREIDEERSRGDEAEPTDADEDTAEGDEETVEGVQREAGEYPDPPSGCHRRGCQKRAAFAVVERYQEETGKGIVEAKAFLCREHTAEEGPSNLDSADGGYVFRIEPLADDLAT